ncbi:MAG: translation initiation factor 2 [Oscillospiraceae bacterium]|nr:translation initiation factor 2 [Oscillospiraceae bacterium]
MERKEIRSAKGGNSVVKGVSRRIVVVPSPDPEIFEKAIFIVREDFVGEKGLTDKDILRQARQAAGSFARSRDRRGSAALDRLRGGLYAAAGAAAAAIAWAAVHMAGIMG